MNEHQSRQPGRPPRSVRRVGLGDGSRPRRVAATPGHTRAAVNPEELARSSGQPAPDSYTRGELRAWLTSSPEDYSPQQLAAVLMLCDHRSWLDRADFRVLACDVRPEAEWARVDPGEALAACEDGRMHPYANSAYTILQIASMLFDATRPLTRPVLIGRLDRGNVALVMCAFAAACGYEMTPAGLLRVPPVKW